MQNHHPLDCATIFVVHQCPDCHWVLFILPPQRLHASGWWVQLNG